MSDNTPSNQVIRNNRTSSSDKTGVLDSRSPDEIDLMDLLVTAAESWKLLLLGPIIAAIVVLGISRFSPQQFESTLVVPLPAASNQALVAAGGVSAVLGFRAADDEGIDILAEPSAFRISARNALTGNVTLSARSSDPSRAQKLLSVFAARLIALITAQKEATSKEIQVKLKAYSQQNEALEKIISLPLNVNEATAGKGDRGIITAALRLTDQVRENQIAMGELERQLADLKSPITSSSPPRGLPISRSVIFPLSVTLSLSTIALLIFIFSREAIRTAGTVPEFSSKLLRLKRVFNIKP